MGILKGRLRGDGGRERMDNLGNRGRQVQGGRHVGWIGRRVNRPLLFSSRFGFESIDNSGTCMRVMRRSSHVWRSDSFAFYSPHPDILAMLVFYICSPCRCIVYFRSGCFRSSPPPHLSLSLSVSSSFVFCLVAVLFLSQTSKCSLSLAWPHVRVRYRFISWLLAVTYVFFSFCG